MLEAVHGFPPYALVALQTRGNYLYLGGQVGSTHFDGCLAKFELNLDIPSYMLSTLDTGRQTRQHKITSKLGIETLILRLGCSDYHLPAGSIYRSLLSEIRDVHDSLQLCGQRGGL